jgi:hypothetical protein
LCPFDRAVERLAVRRREPVAAAPGRLPVDAIGEARLLVPELVRDVVGLLAAEPLERRVRAPERVERDPPEGRDPAFLSVVFARSIAGKRTSRRRFEG